MTSTPAPPERPLRRDAERNRRLVMEAALEVFAERGLGASLDDVAARAGVGIGTVYRRFSDKEQLIDALFEERIGGVVVAAQEGLAIDDPWDGLVHFMTRTTELQTADRGLRELMTSSHEAHARVAGARARIAPLALKLLKRAQRAGVVRDDLAVYDLPMIQLALTAIADYTRDTRPETWRRLQAIVLDGLRPDRDGPSQLPVGPLGRLELEAAMRAAGLRRQR